MQYDSAAVRRYIGVKLAGGRVKEYAVETVSRVERERIGKMGDPKMTCSLPWSPEELAQIRRERANFDEENLTALRATRPHFILCEECSGKGLIEDDGQYRECPVCDGTPMITFELVKQYAEQIDSLRKQLRERSK